MSVKTPVRTQPRCYGRRGRIWLGLLILANFSGCESGPKKSNFREPIGEYLKRSDQACFSPILAPSMEFPMTLAKRSLEGRRIPELMILVDAGLLSAAAVEVKNERRGIFSSGETTVSATEFSLTPAGKEYFRTVRTALGAQWTVTKFCYGAARLKEVVSFTMPADLNGKRVSEVSYTYVIEDIAEWARAKKVLDAFPGVRRDVETEGSPNAGRAILVLTSDGWKVGS